MQYEGLKPEDKEYVRDVVIKVCGGIKNNHMNFMKANDYLKEQNAIRKFLWVN
jgi:hypothetical protein